jgi:hypothetical protein
VVAEHGNCLCLRGRDLGDATPGNRRADPSGKAGSRLNPELLATGNSRGPNDAPAKIIMFSDLWCSVCCAAHGPLMDFQAAHPTRVQVIFRHRPLTWVRGHETSATAAALSEIAAEQGSFWRFVEEVYHQSEPLDRAGYLRLFHKLGLPAAAAEDVFTPHGTPSGQVGRNVSLAERNPGFYCAYWGRSACRGQSSRPREDFELCSCAGDDIALTFN